jgi:hypothetical protein
MITPSKIIKPGFSTGFLENLEISRLFSKRPIKPLVMWCYAGFVRHVMRLQPRRVCSYGLPVKTERMCRAGSFRTSTSAFMWLFALKSVLNSMNLSIADPKVHWKWYLFPAKQETLTVSIVSSASDASLVGGMMDVDFDAIVRSSYGRCREVGTWWEHYSLCYSGVTDVKDWTSRSLKGISFVWERQPIKNYQNQAKTPET